MVENPTAPCHGEAPHSPPGMPQEASPPRPRHVVLSLDLGSDTGWCLGENGIIVNSGVQQFKDGGTHPGLRFNRFEEFLSGFHRVSEIFYEDTPMYASLVHARVNCGMLAVLQQFSVRCGIPLTCMHASSVKKAFTGSGKAKKDEICASAHKLGWMSGKKGTTMCHDEADSIAVYFSIMQRRGIQVMFPAFEAFRTGLNLISEAVTAPPADTSLAGA